MELQLKDGLTALGLPAHSRILHRFLEYRHILLEQNKLMNLTAITDPEQVLSLHFLDSLCLFSAYPLRECSVIDVGSGAGFPGLPLKIAEPSLSLTLLDATAKRVSFLSDLCAKLDLTDVSCIYARAEELSLLPGHRDHYDAAVSRAVAELPVLCELCLPFVRPGGVFLAMKTTGKGGETASSANAISALGGELLPYFDYTVPGTDIPRRIIRIRKTAPTPKGYPRRFSAIKKSPL